MLHLIETSIDCPYCGERLAILVEPYIEQQSYVEDCQVCCSPILLDVQVEGDVLLSITAQRENY